MGLFPQPDSPHYGKAKVISVADLEAIIHERIFQYIPKDGEGSTAGPITTNEQLQKLWRDVQYRHPYYLYIVIEGKVWAINGVVFSRYPGQYLNLLIGRIGEGRNLDINFDFGFGGFDRMGKLINGDNLTIIKEGFHVTHNPSQMMFYELELRVAFVNLSVPISFLKDFYGKEIEGPTFVEMRLDRNDGVRLYLNADLEYTVICKCIITNELTGISFALNGQIPYEWLDLDNSLDDEECDEISDAIRPQLVDQLPDFFTVGEITFQEIRGW